MLRYHDMMILLRYLCCKLWNTSSNSGVVSCKMVRELHRIMVFPSPRMHSLLDIEISSGMLLGHRFAWLLKASCKFPFRVGWCKIPAIPVNSFSLSRWSLNFPPFILMPSRCSNKHRNSRHFTHQAFSLSRWVSNSPSIDRSILSHRMVQMQAHCQREFHHQYHLTSLSCWSLSKQIIILIQPSPAQPHHWEIIIQ